MLRCCLACSVHVIHVMIAFLLHGFTSCTTSTPCLDALERRFCNSGMCMATPRMSSQLEASTTSSQHMLHRSVPSVPSMADVSSTSSAFASDKVKKAVRLCTWLRRSFVFPDPRALLRTGSAQTGTYAIRGHFISDLLRLL